MQRQIVKELLKEQLQRQLKVKKLNAKLEMRLEQTMGNKDILKGIGLRDLETLQAVDSLDQNLNQL